jgi:hypothetical protein
MPAVPQILKTIVFTLDTEDFSLDVLDVAVVPAPGAIQTVRTLDGVTHQDAESESWALQLRCVIDWDSVRPGLAYFLYDRRGETVDFTFRDTTAAISTTKPAMTGEVTLVPIPYGGTGNAYAEATVLLPMSAAPTVDTTP